LKDRLKLATLPKPTAKEDFEREMVLNRLDAEQGPKENGTGAEEFLSEARHVMSDSMKLSYRTRVVKAESLTVIREISDRYPDRQPRRRAPQWRRLTMPTRAKAAFAAIGVLATLAFAGCATAMNGASQKISAQ
jgi:hypothetical protein